MPLKTKLYKLKFNLLALSALLFIMPFALPLSAYAACNTAAAPPTVKVTKDKDGKVIKTEKVPGKTATAQNVKDCLANNKIVKDINAIINFLAAGVGIVVVGAIIVGGIQYAIAGNNPSNVTAAKKRITDALIALLAFICLYACLEWLIPGGTPPIIKL
jgi:hypothetical protein